ncbi:MAG: hypothetical protein AAB074_17390 [Planctomycetota bacterium]
MRHYTVFGLRLDTDIEFPDLPGWDEEGSPATRRTVATFRLSPSAPPTPHKGWVFEVQGNDGTSCLSIGPAADRMLLRFHGLADFLVARGELHVEALPAPGSSVESVRHLFLDDVLPRALSASGRTVLHASAVETDRGAIAFIGESGSGKSTLAASFCASGARLLSDDGVLLDENSRIVPAYPIHRLWPSSAPVFGGGQVPDSQTKQRLVPTGSRWSSSPAPLWRLFFLAPHRPGRPWIQRASGGEAMLALVRQAFRLDPTDRGRACAEFRYLGDLSAAFPPLALSHPRRVEDLAEVQKKISELS